MFALFQPVAERRLESFVVMIIAIFVYYELGFAWPLFAALFFVPDLSMLAYFVAGKKLGGLCYNIMHCFALPLFLGFAGYLTEQLLAQQISLIWLAHCAFDRSLGWGLKYENGFCSTDMGVKKLPVHNKYLA